MGDRANVAVVQDDKRNLVYLYTHWGGSELPLTVQRALARKWRWEDGAYLTRIIFDTMTEGEHGEETGYGISNSRCDNEHSIVVVNPNAQIVGFALEGLEPTCFKTWSFVEYVALPLNEIVDWYDNPKGAIARGRH